MRPLKYKNLGEMSIIRVPQITSAILPQLQDVMQHLEENGEDSREVILQVLSDIEDRLGWLILGPWKCVYSVRTTQLTLNVSNRSELRYRECLPISCQKGLESVRCLVWASAQCSDDWWHWADWNHRIWVERNQPGFDACRRYVCRLISPLN